MSQASGTLRNRYLKMINLSRKSPSPQPLVCPASWVLPEGEGVKQSDHFENTAATMSAIHERQLNCKMFHNQVIDCIHLASNFTQARIHIFCSTV